MRNWVLPLLAAMAWATPAAAKDTTPCPKDLICASDPESVAAQVLRAGYKALLGKDKVGDPQIESAAEGYDWQVLFYDCENHAQCASVQFYIAFKADPTRTPALANQWNLTKRFGQMSVTDKGGIRISYDLSTVGGIPPANFNDQISWWASIIGQFDKFIADQDAAARTPAQTPAAK
jgi:hypothetical protein